MWRLYFVLQKCFARIFDNMLFYDILGPSKFENDDSSNLLIFLAILLGCIRQKFKIKKIAAYNFKKKSMKSNYTKNIISSFSLIFTSRSLLRMGYCCHCTRTSVRTKFFLRFLVFWDPHVGSS